MRPWDPYTSIPALKVGSREVTKNKAKAKAFLEAFFLKMVDLEEDNTILSLEEIPWHLITKLEIH
jgi:hypothetical protein